MLSLIVAASIAADQNASVMIASQPEPPVRYLLC
jgi:hypothetical protein